MVAGLIRRCKRTLPITLFFLTLLTVLLWRIFNSNGKNGDIHPKHIYRKNQEEYVDKNGIKVVVGHYVGNSVKNIPDPPEELINQNNFQPIANSGKNGIPVVIQPKDFFKMQQLYKINRYNLLASDRIPLNRTLPDFRRKKCTMLFKNYLSYPKTSIIIVFHNEAWSALMRTVWSVINRSPKELLEEIILVDDASERDFLKLDLDNYISTLPVKTHVLRIKERIGLIKARLKGALMAKGEVLTFLDAHCECTIGWLESLLSAIKEDRKTVVCPIIDIINEETFAYVKSFELHWGAFNWNLQFRWYTLGGTEMKLRKNDATVPFNTPAMAGGLFAMDKDYFFEIGSYDENMNIWGGENLEMSMRVWQCGGKIKIAPCSRVGHVFRKSSPYTFPGGITKTLFSNLARVALVWMDQWANVYFKFNSEARKIKEELNVTNRLMLREQLGCKNFEWYLNNVWPQHFFPANDRFFGRIKNLALDMCLIKPIGRGMSNQPMGIAKLERCLEDVALEMFVMSKEGFIMTDDSVCLDAPEKINNITPLKVRIIACSGFNRQKWQYDNKTNELKHVTNKKCLDAGDFKNFTQGLVINDCDGRATQKWILEGVEWK